MNFLSKDKVNDYRVNFNNNGKIISIEVTCCGRHIGEIRFKNGESKKCPLCGASHSIKIQHNHFHIRPVMPETNNVNSVYAEKAL
ncbi:MAG: hypothetical protein PHY77_03330 [Desulfotomaculaceae bacterium]|nr:hypothetical protein [Desulfotomaculaceae bacterium]